MVGSLNWDLSASVVSFPSPGETVPGVDLVSGGGGKGANQAVAARRLGASVAMVGAVGEDVFGSQLIGMLSEEGIDVSHVRRAGATGTALITVDAAGENTIVVVPGANASVSSGDVADCRGLLVGAKVVLLQLEIPVEAVEAAAEQAHGTVILNAAPAIAGVSTQHVDVLVVNEGELAQVIEVDSFPDKQALVEAIGGLGCAAVVTLGADGAIVVEDGVATYIPAVPVRAVDTTGAGDAFCGGLAHQLSAGASLVEAATWAAVVGAAATLGRGAIAAMPTRVQVEALR